MMRELKTLLAVAREGTFAAAAIKVGLTQAAVSAQMHRLEQSLGFALFDRVGRAARLNTRGRQVCQQARELLDRYQQLGAPVADTFSGRLISLGAIASVQRAFLPAVLSRFYRSPQACRVRVLPGVSTDFVNQVDTGELDMAMVIRPPFSLQGRLRWTQLFREPFRLLVARTQVSSDWAQLLATLPFIRYDHASFGGRQVERFLQDRQIAVRDIFELDELEAIVQLVARGVGVALLPQSSVHRRWPAQVRAIDLGKATFYREIGLVHAPENHLDAPVVYLLDLLRRQAGRAQASARIRP
jgi:DNA-binding transcriptional LysR family regulator